MKIIGKVQRGELDIHIRANDRRDRRAYGHTHYIFSTATPTGGQFADAVRASIGLFLNEVTQASPVQRLRSELEAYDAS